MTIKHTEGPWKHDLGNWNIESRSDNGPFRKIVCCMRPACLESDFGDGNTLDGYEKNFENGRLIAAAPELLEACESLVRNSEAFGPCGASLREHFREVIKKAKGEE